MEQRLDATHLRPGVFERAAAVALAVTGAGAGILLASWGISLVWRYAPPEIPGRLANQVVRIVQDEPFEVRQDKPFVVVQSAPTKIEQGQAAARVEQLANLPVQAWPGSEPLTASGDIIRREVTVFSEVRHGPGAVVTGWNYKDGSGGVPRRQFCYYTIRNEDQSSRRVDLAFDGARQTQIVDLVPEIEGALSKCQWWQPS